MPSMRGEVLSSRALALATIARVEDATELAEAAARATRGVETQAYVSHGRGSVLAEGASGRRLERSEMLDRACLRDRMCRPRCDGYRANPELLAILLASRRLGDKVVYLVGGRGTRNALRRLVCRHLCDGSCAHLSAREREVYDAGVRGRLERRNRSTTVYCAGHSKVARTPCVRQDGNRSGSALALNAAQDRYATSAATSVTGRVRGTRRRRCRSLTPGRLCSLAIAVARIERNATTASV